MWVRQKSETKIELYSLIVQRNYCNSVGKQLCRCNFTAVSDEGDNKSWRALHLLKTVITTGYVVRNLDSIPGKRLPHKPQWTHWHPHQNGDLVTVAQSRLKTNILSSSHLVTKAEMISVMSALSLLSSSSMGPGRGSCWVKCSHRRICCRFCQIRSASFSHLLDSLPNTTTGWK